MTMRISVKGKLGEIWFSGLEGEWKKDDNAVASLCGQIFAFHEGGCDTIIINLEKVGRTDNHSAEELATFLRNDPIIKVAFYGATPYVKNSLCVNHINPEVFFANKEAALASFK